MYPHTEKNVLERKGFLVFPFEQVKLYENISPQQA